jgi:hypothetical protein
MQLANDHERLIAHVVDQKVVENPSNGSGSIVWEVAISLDFMMSASDSQFLVRYVRRRRAHPCIPIVGSYAGCSTQNEGISGPTKARDDPRCFY